MSKPQGGWIKIHRKIEEWEHYFSEPFDKTHAWIDLLLLANHERRSLSVRGNLVTVERGELAWSEESLAKRWKWSRCKVRRFLTWLKTIQQIDQQKSRLISKIIVINYETYQNNDTAGDTTERRQNVQQKDINKNDKNVKKDKKDTNTGGGDIALPAPLTPRDETIRFFTEPEAREPVIEWMETKGISREAAAQEINRFVMYWTEPTPSGKKQRWETERTFEVKRRLVTWLQRSMQRNANSRPQAETKGIRL